MKIEERILQRKRDDVSDWHTPKLGVYHASQIYDIYKGTLKPENFFKVKQFSDSTLMIFEIGNMYHDYIQGLYPKENTEVPVSLDFGQFKIVGHADLVIDDIPCELKTCSTFPKQFFAAHNCQLQIYMAALEKEYGFLTYIEKNPKTFHTKDFRIPKDTYLLNSIVEKVTEFHEKLVKVEEENKLTTNLNK